MLEKTVEAYLVERVRALGGTAYKFTSPARASVPDRIVILPPGRIFFVELKRPGGKLTRGQEREHEHLRRLGTDVRMLDSIGAINAFLNEVQAVAADGAAQDDLLQLDVLLAALHEAVWEAGSNAWPAYDIAGKDEAKAIQRHVRAMLAEREAVSPATAALPIKIPHVHIRPEDEEIGRQYYALGFVDGSRSITDAPQPAMAEKVYYGGSVEAEPVAFDEPATADERAAFDFDVLREYLRQLNGAFSAALDSGYAPGSDAAKKARSQFYKTMSSFEALIDTLARASQAAAPAEARESSVVASGLIGLARHVRAVPAYSKLVGDMDIVDQAIAILNGAPADAREPDAYILPYDLEVLKTYSAQCQVTLYREPRKTRVPLYAGCAPADAGEAVAPSADLIARCRELLELSDHGESEQTALRALANTYRRDISPHDRRAMATSHTHLEAVKFVLDAAAQGAQGGKGGEA
ncbi:hypothetical protein QZM99_00670 [Burkholderia gladioli]|uniref:hypothetical protein n=1 Tax=Burkholderia gladioli TaxID=28095 RepID=UPI00264D499F|nr:hypothetical protein [Burkholderia gladioli]MDN7916604.1 hypothetical protein [Burkholderia gladioli]